MAGCLIAAVTYFPLFKGLTHYVNPALETYQTSTSINVAAKDCHFHIFVGPWSKFSDCDKTQDFLTKAGLSFTTTVLPADSPDTVITKIGTVELKGFDDKKYAEVLKAGGYPQGAADKSKINYPMTMLILVIMMIYVTMVYGPIAAFLVELFPTRIRYTSMSLPYHIGNGWFGGMLPLLATALVAWSRRHLLWPLVPDHRRLDDLRCRSDFPARSQGPRHRVRLEVTTKNRTCP